MAHDLRKEFEERLEMYEMKAHAMRIAIEELDDVERGRRVPRQRSVVKSAIAVDNARRNGRTYRQTAQSNEPAAEMPSQDDEREQNDPHEDLAPAPKKKSKKQKPPPATAEERRRNTLAVLETLDLDEPRPVRGTGRAGNLLRAGYIKKKGGKGLYVRTNIPFHIERGKQQ